MWRATAFPHEVGTNWTEDAIRKVEQPTLKGALNAMTDKLRNAPDPPAGWGYQINIERID